MKWVQFVLYLLIGGLFRYYFCIEKDPYLDELIFYGYVREPGWEPLFWSNYPPLAIFAFKIFGKLGVVQFGAFRVCVFLISLVNMLGFWMAIKKRPNAWFYLALWALTPVGLNAATQVNPTIWVELFSVLVLWLVLALNNQINILRGVGIFAGTILIYLTTYSTPVFLLYLSLFYLRVKKYFLLVVVILSAGASAWSLSKINWATLAWLDSSGPINSVLQGLEHWFNYFSYSWAVTALVGIAILISKDRWRLREYLFFPALFCVCNLILGIRATEPRFFYFFVPFFVVLMGSVLNISQKYLRISVVVLVLGITVKNALWFAINPRNGFDEAIEYAKSKNVQTLYIHNMNPMMSYYFEEKGIRPEKNTPAKDCRNCLILTFGPTQFDLSQYAPGEQGFFPSKGVERLSYIHTRP